MVRRFFGMGTFEAPEMELEHSFFNKGYSSELDFRMILSETSPTTALGIL